MSQTYDKLRASRQPRERKPVVRPARAARSRSRERSRDMAKRRMGGDQGKLPNIDPSRLIAGGMDFWSTLTLKGKVVSVVGLFLVGYILLWMVRLMTMDPSNAQPNQAGVVRSVPVPLDFSGEAGAPASGAAGLPRFDPNIPPPPGPALSPPSRLPAVGDARSGVSARLPRVPQAPLPPATMAPPLNPSPSSFPQIVASGRYRVVVGSFSNQNNAASLKRRINSKGVPAEVQKAKGNGWTRVQVQLGPFASADDARLAISILREKTGIKGRMSTHGGGSIDRKQTQSRATPNYPPARAPRAASRSSSMAPNSSTPPPSAIPKKMPTKRPSYARAEPPKAWQPPVPPPQAAAKRPKPARRTPPAPVKEYNGKYIVLAGSFTSWGNAEKIRKIIAAQDLPVWLRTVDVNGRNYTRVQVGPFANKSDARSTMALIRNNTDITPKFLMAGPEDRRRPAVDRKASSSVQVRRSTAPARSSGNRVSRSSGSSGEGIPSRSPGRYLVFVGSFSTAENADRLRQRLEAKGIPVRMKSSASRGGMITHVQVGPFSRERDAETAVRVVRERTGLSAKSVHTKGIIER
ncbi:MAG: SPOR domain-containing protein [Magnetococcales bacterium]|nr:SPOR domain-containing protein [Magnetococcales bacterium]